MVKREKIPTHHDSELGTLERVSTWGVMSGIKTNKDAAEKLLESAFTDLLAIAQREGITVKRMRELLSRAQVCAMRAQGMTQQEIMAASGYSLKTIRRLLHDENGEDNTDLVNRFVGDWSSDPEFPNRLVVSDQPFPSFMDLCSRYGGDFTPPSLLQILLNRGLVEVNDGYIELQTRALTPSPGHEMLEFARVSIHSLLNTLSHNLAGQQPPHLERRLWSHRMPKSQVAELRIRVREHANRFRDEVLREMDELETVGRQQHDIGNNSDRETSHPGLGIGLYWFELDH